MTDSPNDDRRPAYSQKELQIRQFDQWGERGVRDRIASGRYQGRLLEWAEEWVSLRDFEARAAEETTARDLASREALAADKKARSAERSNAIATRAKTAAKTAIKFAVVAAAVSIVAGIGSR